MSSYPFFIPEFVLCANSSLFSFKIANEPSEFRNYLNTDYRYTFLCDDGLFLHEICILILFKEEEDHQQDHNEYQQHHSQADS